MKVRVADSAGCPFPQFVVEAETEQERIILKAFLSPMTFSRPSDPQPWIFGLYGSVRGGNGYTSFNFGWQRRPEDATEEQDDE